MTSIRDKLKTKLLPELAELCMEYVEREVVHHKIDVLELQDFCIQLKDRRMLHETGKIQSLLHRGLNWRDEIGGKRYEDYRERMRRSDIIQIKMLNILCRLRQKYWTQEMMEKNPYLRT